MDRDTELEALKRELKGAKYRKADRAELIIAQIQQLEGGASVTASADKPVVRRGRPRKAE